MAGEAHLVPFRTQKLSPRAPMVLRSQSVGEQDAADQLGAFRVGEAPGSAAGGLPPYAGGRARPGLPAAARRPGLPRALLGSPAPPPGRAAGEPARPARRFRVAPGAEMYRSCGGRDSRPHGAGRCV